MKNFTFKSVLAAAALLLGTTGSWAYEVPDGMEIKQVLIGNQNGTVVDPLTFDTEGDAVPTFGNKAYFAIADEVPTDVWNDLALHMSGKSLRLGSRTTHEIDFTAPLTSGKVVFSSDFYVGIHAKSIKFIDADDNVVLYFTFPDKSATNGRVYGTQYLFVPGDEAAVFSSTPKMNDTYLGTRNREYQISELVFDLDNNKITYSGKIMDRRSSTNMWCADNATITLSKSVSIKGMIIDASACGSSSYYAYFDNMLLYNVGIKAGAHNYTINAVAGGETIKKLGSGVANEGDAYAFAVSEVIEKDGQYYVLDDANVENYKVSYVMGNADEVKEINYVLDESIVYYAEGETLGSTSELDGASNGFYGHVVGGNGQNNTGYRIGSLAAGTYQASAYFVSADVTKNRGFCLRNTALANADDANVVAAIYTTTAGLYSSEVFTLTEELTLSVSGKTTSLGKVNQSAEFDYIIIRTADPTTGIASVNTQVQNNVYFNMAGQRVAQPAKGLYIVNGKKVVIK